MDGKARHLPRHTAPSSVRRASVYVAFSRRSRSTFASYLSIPLFAAVRHRYCSRLASLRNCPNVHLKWRQSLASRRTFQ